MSSQISSPSARANFEKIVRLIDPSYRLLSVQRMEGGVSAQVTRLVVAGSDGNRRSLLVRRHGAADRRRSPHLAADEFRLLHILHAKGLRTQTPIFLDESCRLFATAYLVIDYIEGQTDFSPVDLASTIEQMAGQLQEIHRIDRSSADLDFLPLETIGYGPRPAVLDDTIGEQRIRDTLETLRPSSSARNPVLLHGDFWPGNVLWRGGRLVGVIDWENAKLGHPLSDLGNSRLEMLWAYGEEAMQHFTLCYRSLSGVDLTDLPYWDLCAALRPAHKLSDWAVDKAAEARMRLRLARFVELALRSAGQ